MPRFIAIVSFGATLMLIGAVNNSETNEIEFFKSTQELGAGDLAEYRGEDCHRECSVHGRPRICYFNFVMEHYHAMGPACGKCAIGKEEDCHNVQCITADGVERGVLSINRKIPGPAIQVCKDDLIVVDAVNNMAGEASSIHWHGLHQKDTPFMDGVPFITQCPVDFSTTFRYTFRATEPGTQFYHSHSGHQKVNGHYGALIIREPSGDDPNSHLYDYDLPEHYILMSDWMHEIAEMFSPGLPTRGTGIQPDSVLINGRGQFIQEMSSDIPNVPLTKYHVRKDKRYRFRVINSGSHVCPFQLQVEKHKLLIIASDSYNVQPQSFDTLISTAGERYDFVLSANQLEGDYFIRMRAIGLCANRPLESFAILSYKKSNPEAERPKRTPPSYSEPFPSGVYLNHPNASCFETNNDHCITELKSWNIDNGLRYGTPDHRLFLAFNNYEISNDIIFKEGYYKHFMNIRDNQTLMGAINKLSFVFPTFPLLTQPEQIDKEMFCDDDNPPSGCSDGKICSCLHLEKIKLHSIVELIIVDETATIQSLNHPFHLHGFGFMVTDMGQNPYGTPMTVQIAKQLYNSNVLHSTPFNRRAPFKDTISIPSRGYATVRLRADNPGFWLLHCHYDWHLATGMAMVLQVGDPRDMVPPPKGFPKCDNYIPDIRDWIGNNRN